MVYYFAFVSYCTRFIDSIFNFISLNYVKTQHGTIDKFSSTNKPKIKTQNCEGKEKFCSSKCTHHTRFNACALCWFSFVHHSMNIFYMLTDYNFYTYIIFSFLLNSYWLCTPWWNFLPLLRTAKYNFFSLCTLDCVIQMGSYWSHTYSTFYWR